MNRIDATFGRLRSEGKTAMMPFITAGDPDLDTTVDIILALERAGADLIELGVPYSDPLADGPVIQRASQRALVHRITIVDCMAVAKRARERGSQLPFVLFTYYNPALQLGLDQFFELLIEHDISGIIIPDLPIEEDQPVRERSVQYGIHMIPLVAPTSKERIATIAGLASGFVYCVSSMGVTGVRSEFDAGVDSFLTEVKQAATVPIAVGFGISTPEQVKRFGTVCDGVIIGSAIVRKIEEVQPLLLEAETREEGLEQIYRFVRQLKGA